MPIEDNEKKYIIDVQKEKEWLHRINGAQTSKKSDQEVGKTSSAKAETAVPMNKKAHSFKDEPAWTN